MDDEALVYEPRDYGEDNRFSDPTVLKLKEVWRQRQDMVRTMTGITLRMKSMCRRLCGGDKDEANDLYKAVMSDKATHPLYREACVILRPLRAARDIIERERKLYEKQVAVLAKTLPIAHMVDDIPGLGYPGLGAIVGECGDLSKYPNPSGVWKRAGLAVIEGERQRRVRGERALLHGYSPERRAVFWTLTDALFKSQSRGMKDGKEPGHYRQIYDRRREYEGARMATGEVKSKGHAHNRALRYMCKRLLRDMWEEWVLVAGGDE